MDEAVIELNCATSILFKKLTPQIRKIIASVVHFTPSYEYDDYMQEAFLACCQAVTLYKKMNGERRNRMQLAVFAHWHVRKWLYALADTGEIAYEVYSPDGQYTGTFRNAEFRKKRRAFEAQGFGFRSVNLRESLYFTGDDGKEVERPVTEKTE